MDQGSRDFIMLLRRIIFNRIAKIKKFENYYVEMKK